MFKRFHTAYVDAVSNPFYTTSTVSLQRDAVYAPPQFAVIRLLQLSIALLSCCLLMSLQSVTSKRFDASVRTMVTSLGAS